MMITRRMKNDIKLKMKKTSLKTNSLKFSINVLNPSIYPAGWDYFLMYM